MGPWSVSTAPPSVILLLFHCLLLAQATVLSLPPSWTFSVDLAFPSSSSVFSLNSYRNIAPFSVFAPILSSSAFDAGSKGFSFGFLSLFQSSSASPTQIYLSICIGARKDGERINPFLLPVWSLNNSRRPLRQQGGRFVKLSVNGDREWLLEDGDGSVVWRLSNVQSMEMQDNGNLMFFDPKNETLWQSFDHPSDTLLQGQKFRLHMEITSRNLVYRGAMDPGGLFLYAASESTIPLVYWIIAANQTVNNFLDGELGTFLMGQDGSSISLTAALAASDCVQRNDSLAFAMLEGKQVVLQGVCTELNTSIPYRDSDLVRLDDDGYLREYLITQLANSSFIVSSSRENFKSCDAPNVCGAYGICSSTVLGEAREHQCRCPSEMDDQNLTKAFDYIDASNPSQGCRRTTSLDCKQGTAQSFGQIKKATSICVPYFHEVVGRESTMPLERCLAECASNCSCSGAFYHTTSSFCLPFGDDTAMSNLSILSLPLEEYSTFIKIQAPRKNILKKYLPAIVIVPSVSVVLAVLIAMAIHKRMQDEDPEMRLAERELLDVLPSPPTRYSYQELSRITEGFSKHLGSGGFGSVYEGMLPDERKVAVKKLKVLSRGQEEFLAEIATIGSVTHINIVRLYGFCLERQHRLLVYEYMQNSSLEKWLFSREGQQNGHVMSWETRFNVALGASRGLAYLHEDCHKCILHLDVKPQNILLDEEFNAKLADFGLSKLVARGATSMITPVGGTPGYIAPELMSQGRVSDKCDVYSFGKVLLVLVSGRRNAEMSMVGTQQRYFPKWALKSKRQEIRVGELLDRRLVEAGEEVEEEQVRRVVGVALMCIHKDPSKRPSMRTVCGMLDESIPFPNDALDSLVLVETVAPRPNRTPSNTSTASDVQGMSMVSSIEPR